MIFQISDLVDQRQLVPLRHLLGLVDQVDQVGHVDQVDQVDDNGDDDDFGIIVNDDDMFVSTTQE